jgi:NAD(P)-dependent dehydrogenase (short-subunit alcohol dehydrogenase family)
MRSSAERESWPMTTHFPKTAVQVAAAVSSTPKRQMDIKPDHGKIGGRTTAMSYVVKSAVPHMPKGSSTINTASVNVDAPSPHLLAYVTTKGAIQNFT